MSEMVVVAGMSGAGRATLGNNLEDLGWNKIESVPPALLPLIGELQASGAPKYERMAVVLGTTSADEVLPAIEAVRAMNIAVRIVFLDSTDEVLVRRYENTRRPHPFRPGASVSDSIAAERGALEGLRAVADMVIDTSSLNVHELRRRIAVDFAIEGTRSGMQTRVLSFGYKHGLPTDVDIVIDCRFLPNPHWVDELRPLTGLDQPVEEYVLGQPIAGPFLEQIERLLTLVMPQYVREGKAYLSIAFGCTGGHHRSVVIACKVGELLSRMGYSPSVAHRDIARG